MRIVNESIARQANEEDNCTGRFWEGRFKSQALLDDGALLACMAYVDLNPVRAKIANTPEKSEFTSINKRIILVKNNQPPLSYLEAFVGIQEKEIGIPFRLIDYLELVDWTGRIIREGKRGAIQAKLTSHTQTPRNRHQGVGYTYHRVWNSVYWVGSEHIVRQVCSDKAYQRIPSTAPHRRLLGKQKNTAS